VDAVSCIACVGVGGRLARLPALELANGPSQPFRFFTLNGLTWVDWATVIGLILTIIGFGITWWQLNRTKTAKQAVTESIMGANRETAGSRLTKTLSSLPSLNNKVYDALDKDDLIALRKALENWTRDCSRVISQLGRVQATPNRTQAHRGSRQEIDQIAESAKQFVAARLAIDEALLKLRSWNRKTQLSTEISHALRKMRECSNLAVMIIEEDQYRKVA
jgi:hypothetical protein